jgi:hypothetical protein
VTARHVHTYGHSDWLVCRCQDFYWNGFGWVNVDPYRVELLSEVRV